MTKTRSSGARGLVPLQLCCWSEKLGGWSSSTYWGCCYPSTTSRWYGGASGSHVQRRDCTVCCDFFLDYGCFIGWRTGVESPH